MADRIDANAIAIPDDEEPAGRCPFCERPFRHDRFLDLHLGQAHSPECDEDQIQRYEEANDAESDDLFVFHLKVVAAIVAVIMGYVYLYGFVLS
jgi:hypothetical protein